MRSHFPLFRKNPELVYLDSAATALKPQVVIDAMTDYLSTYSSNIGRGLYPLAGQATLAFETAREKGPLAS
jgi:cysteine desulfurase/selenocysteine lyase